MASIILSAWNLIILEACALRLRGSPTPVGMMYDESNSIVDFCQFESYYLSRFPGFPQRYIEPRRRKKRSHHWISGGGEVVAIVVAVAAVGAVNWKRFANFCRLDGDDENSVGEGETGEFREEIIKEYNISRWNMSISKPNWYPDRKWIRSLWYWGRYCTLHSYFCITMRMRRNWFS